MAKAKTAEVSEGMALQEEDGTLTVDMGGVDENASFPVMPRGKYPCVVENMTYGLSQASGNPMWSLILEVEGGEHAGQKLFTHIVFSEKALPMAKKTIMAIAPQILEGPFKPEEVADEGVMLGVRCIARVDIGSYEGKPRNQVKSLHAPEEAGEGEGFM